MLKDELTLALSAVREACRLAEALREQIVAARAHAVKEDRSPVTMADLAVQAVVSRRLATRFPADPLLAEESSRPLVESPSLERQTLDLARQSLADLEAEELRSLLDRSTATPGTAERWWVLDPIDGTKGFLRGDQYAVALALIADRQVVLGVLGCPQLPSRRTNAEKGCLLWAVRGGGAWQCELAGSEMERIRVDGVSDPGAATVVEPVEQGHYDPELVVRILARLGVAGAARRVDSQCKYALVARGDASVYLRLVREATAENVWDHAAGALLVEEAGGWVTNLEGRPLDLAAGRRMPASRGVIASNGAVHQAVLAAARAELGG